MERQKQLLDLRARILQAEEDRLQGAGAMSIHEAMRKRTRAVKSSLSYVFQTYQR